MSKKIHQITIRNHSETEIDDHNLVIYEVISDNKRLGAVSKPDLLRKYYSALVELKNKKVEFVNSLREPSDISDETLTGIVLLTAQHNHYC